MPTFFRQWKRDGATRTIGLDDAIDWIIRNQPARADRLERDQIEQRLRRGETLESPEALLGSDPKAMERRRQALRTVHEPIGA